MAKYAGECNCEAEGLVEVGEECECDVTLPTRPAPPKAAPGKRFVDFNTNNRIRFKIPPSQKPEQLFLLKPDKEGYVTMTLWQWAQTFGKTFYNGSDWSTEVQLEISQFPT